MTILYVQSMGGKGLPLVLFHGWGFDSQVWQPLLPELLQSFEVYVVDLPGFGLSSLMEWEAFKSMLLPQLPSTFALLGWSMGGGYAIQLASEAPERVSHLIGVGASPKFIRDSSWPGIDVNAFDIFMTQLVIDPIQTLKSFVKVQTGKEPQLEFTRLPKLASLEAGLLLLQNWDLREELKQVKHACFMFGRLDAIVPARTLTAMRTHYPHYEYVLFEQGAHMPFISDKMRFLEQLRLFCN
jgi:pimeloyl-[acyl-carrier protein] methyl ester esterase